jgi:hypothetical protein
MTRVSVLVPSWRTREATLRSLRSVVAQLGPDDEVILVDDAGGDGTAAAARATLPRVVVVEHAANLGYTRALLSAVASARGSMLLLFNSDARLLPGALEALVRFLDDHPAHAAVAPRLVDAQGATRLDLMNLPRAATPWSHALLVRALLGETAEWRRWHARDVEHGCSGDVEQPPGACLLLRRSDWDECGGMDVGLRLFFSDVELCARLRERGRLVGYLADVVVEHDGGASTRQLADFAWQWHRDRYRFHRARHGLAGALSAYCSSGLDLAWSAWRAPRAERWAALARAWLALPFGRERKEAS